MEKYSKTSGSQPLVLDTSNLRNTFLFNTGYIKIKKYEMKIIRSRV